MIFQAPVYVVCWTLHLILDPLLHILEGVTRNLKTTNMEGKSKAIFFQNHETDKKVLIICIVKFAQKTLRMNLCC